MSTVGAAAEVQMNLETFTLWGKRELQAYLRKRGLPVSGTKKELVALAFAAWTMKTPVVPTVDEKLNIRAEEYRQLLHINGVQLPDPLSDLKSGWESEGNARTKWPCTMIVDISEFLEKHDTDIEKASLRKRLLCDYKEGKAFSYFSSSFLFEIWYHCISASSTCCFLKSKCRPSFAVHDEPHDVWVCINKQTGTVLSAYCTCFAGICIVIFIVIIIHCHLFKGAAMDCCPHSWYLLQLELGQSCNHIAALLLKVDFCWKYGYVNPSCTSLPCTWKTGGKSVVVQPKRIAEMDWKAPHAERLDHKKTINPVCKRSLVPHHRWQNKGMSFEDLLQNLQQVHPTAVILAEKSQERNKNFDKAATTAPFPQTLPPSLPEMAKMGNLVKSCKLSRNEILILEASTRDQAESPLWKEQRKGRLTASRFHDIATKMNTLQKSTNPQAVNVSHLLATIMGYKCPNPYIPSLKYGRTMEPIAKEVYRKFLIEKGHKNVFVKPAGLFVHPSFLYLGASPDAVVTCDCCSTGVVELKCPSSIADQVPSADNLSYLIKTDDGTRLKINHKYYDQCQGQLALTQLIDAKYCDFFVYTMHGSHYERLLFNQEHWSTLQPKLSGFFENFVVDELSKGELGAKFDHSLYDASVTTHDDAVSHPAQDTVPNAATESPGPESPVMAQINDVPPSDTAAQKTRNAKKKKKCKNKRKCAPMYLCPVCSKECVHCEANDTIEPLLQSVGCDGCFNWFHFGCVGLAPTSEELTNDSWYCSNCTPKKIKQTKTL